MGGPSGRQDQGPRPRDHGTKGGVNLSAAIAQEELKKASSQQEDEIQQIAEGASNALRDLHANLDSEFYKTKYITEQSLNILASDAQDKFHEQEANLQTTVGHAQNKFLELDNLIKTLHETTQASELRFRGQIGEELAARDARTSTTSSSPAPAQDPMQAAGYQWASQHPVTSGKGPPGMPPPTNLSGFAWTNLWFQGAGKRPYHQLPGLGHQQEADRFHPPGPIPKLED